MYPHKSNFSSLTRLFCACLFCARLFCCCRRFGGNFFAVFWGGRSSADGYVLIVCNLEGSIPHLFADGTGADTLRTHPNGLGYPAGSGRAHILQIRQECSSGNTGNFRTDTAEIFRLTSCFYAVSETASFAADFTDTCHCNTPIKTPPYSSRESRFGKGSGFCG